MVDHTDKSMVKRIVTEILQRPYKDATCEYYFPIYYWPDDCGLETEEYEEFAALVIEAFLKEEHG